MIGRRELSCSRNLLPPPSDWSLAVVLSGAECQKQKTPKAKRNKPDQKVKDVNRKDLCY